MLTPAPNAEIIESHIISIYSILAFVIGNSVTVLIIRIRQFILRTSVMLVLDLRDVPVPPGSSSDHLSRMTISGIYGGK